MPGNVLSNAPHRDIVVAVSPQTQAYRGAVLWQRKEDVYWRWESIAFTWQGLKNVA